MIILGEPILSSSESSNNEAKIKRTRKSKSFVKMKRKHLKTTHSAKQPTIALFRTSTKIGKISTSFKKEKEISCIDDIRLRIGGKKDEMIIIRKEGQVDEQNRKTRLRRGRRRKRRRLKKEEKDKVRVNYLELDGEKSELASIFYCDQRDRHIYSRNQAANKERRMKKTKIPTRSQQIRSKQLALSLFFILIKFAGKYLVWSWSWSDLNQHVVELKRVISITGLIFAVKRATLYMSGKKEERIVLGETFIIVIIIIVIFSFYSRVATRI